MQTNTLYRHSEMTCPKQSTKSVQVFWKKGRSSFGGFFGRGGLHPNREFFTHTEKSPWLIKASQLGNCCHWAVRVPYRATPIETRNTPILSHFRRPVFLTTVAERFAVELLFLILRLVPTDEKIPISRMRAIHSTSNGFKFWPMLGTRGHWMVMFLYVAYCNTTWRVVV